MMPWLRLDDNAAEDPAVEGLTDKAFRAFIEGMLYCSRNLTDGQITATAAKRRGWSGKVAAQLVAAGLWDIADDGFVVRSYLKYNPDRAQVEVRRERDAAKKAKQRSKVTRNPDGTFCPPGDTPGESL